MRDRLKQLMGPRWQARLRRAGRLRLLSKWQNLRRYGVSLRDQPRLALRYLILDPEVESFTFDVDNEAEHVEFVRQALGAAPEQARGWIEETRTDPELNERLGSHMRLRRLSVKQRNPPGHRLVWYLVVRALKPELTVEAGILNGMGTLVLLRALARNSEEGSPGRLLSFDPVAEAGWLVPERLGGPWERHAETTDEGLERALAGREVGLLVHDSIHDPDVQRRDFETVLRHAAPEMAIVNGGGLLTDVLRTVAVAHGTEHRYLREQPRDHVYRPIGSGLAVFRRA
ncbi:MAG: class I SAM-dependent methyltransferase [Solirubrobacteraceae bacterium]